MRRVHLVVIAVAIAFAWPTYASAGDGKAKGDAAKKVDVDGILDKADEHARKRRWRKAIPLYKEVLVARPFEYPSIYYNLAEITRVLENCNEAVLLYQRYLDLSPDAGDRGEVAKKIAGCNKKRTNTGKITIAVKGPGDPLVVLAGIPVSTKPNATVLLDAGKYVLKVTADDHIGQRAEIEVLAGDERTLDVELVQQTFFGEVKITVNVEGAEIFASGESIGTAPFAENVKVKAGKHFVEIKKDGYHRWIRNIVIGRDEEYVLDVTMQKVKEQ
jgi:tetratricopeptide (TPR) repeat protein